MSNDIGVIKELSKVIKKEFKKMDSRFLDNHMDNSDYVYFTQEEKVIFIGLDLMKLNLADKVLKEIDNLMCSLENLKGLSIVYHKNNEVPEFIKCFKYLESLNLKGLNLKSLPKWMKELSGLIYLNLESNDFILLPDWLGTFNKLKTLKLHHNKNLEWNETNLKILRSVCERNGTISAPRLLEFQARHNLPLEQIEIIQGLEKENTENERMAKHVNPILIKVKDGKVIEWKLSEYNISSLPVNFGVFKNLISLTITQTKIETLPESFGELKELESLNLSSNKLKSLPESFANLVSIKSLNLSNNQFNEIPTQLWALKELSELNLKNNPFNPENKTISQKVPDLIREYLRKKATIRVFISHAVIDFEPYHIRELVDYLEKQKEISQVFFCEEDLAGNIDEWMLNAVQQSQLILFIGTKKSVFNSPDCANELQLADKFSIPVIPIKGPDVNWSDLAEKNLSRELGLEIDKSNFEAFCENLYKYIENFKREINLMDKESRVVGIIDIYERFRLMLDEKLDEIKRQISSLNDRISKIEKKL